MWAAWWDSRLVVVQITTSYFDRETATLIVDGSELVLKVGIGNSSSSTDLAKTTAQLQSPTAYGTGMAAIYSAWDVDIDNADTDDDLTTNVDDPWDFVGNNRYPKLRVDFDGDGMPATAAEFGVQRFYFTKTDPGIEVFSLSVSDEAVAPTIIGYAKALSGPTTWALTDANFAINSGTGVITVKVAGATVATKMLSIEATVGSVTTELNLNVEVTDVTAGSSSPTISSFQDAAGTITSALRGATVKIIGTNFSTTEANNKITVGGIEVIPTSPTAPELTFTVPLTATLGLGPIRVTVSGAANYVQEAFTITAPPSPTITRFEDAGGTITSALRGATVKIIGMNFSTTEAKNTITVGGVTATPTNATATELTFTVPLTATLGLGNIQVEVSGAENAAVLSFTITLPSPTITRFEDAGGTITSALRGDIVKIVGTNFSTTAAKNTITVGGVTATPTNATATELTFTVPAGASPGSGRQIRVTVSGAENAAVLSFTITPPSPTITRFEDTGGTTITSALIGDIVKIIGNNFSTTLANNTITVGGATATLTSATAAELTFTVPAGASPGSGRQIRVTVSVSGAASYVEEAFTITLPSPTISSFQDNAGNALSPATAVRGATVKIIGTNFSTTPANNTITVGGATATLTNATATVLTFTVPLTATLGSGQILRVTVLDAVTAAVLAFEVTAPPSPTISSFQDGSRNTITSALRGATVKIIGMNFSTTEANNTITVGSATATLTSATATELTFTVPLTATLGSGNIQVEVSGAENAAVLSFEVTAPLIEIATLAQLNAIRYDLDGNGTPSGTAAEEAAYRTAFVLSPGVNNTCTGGCEGYELMEDLDFSGSEWAEGGSATTGWMPIGDDSSPFNTTFEGNRRTISNLYINTTTLVRVGLFGRLGSGVQIRNLGLEGGSVSSTVASAQVGGLVGWNNGGTISACYATGDVTGGNAAVGGLVGQNLSGTISACYATGDIRDISGGNDANVGGLVGQNLSGTISACYATGDISGGNDAVVGGLVGYNSGTISACYSTGSATGGEIGVAVGGLLGFNVGGTISACYSTGSARGGGNWLLSSVGGLVGFQGSGRIRASYFDKTTAIFSVGGSAPSEKRGIGNEASSTAIGKITSDLQSPTAYGTGGSLYENWNVDIDNVDDDSDADTPGWSDGGADDPWDFVGHNRYPRLMVDFDGDATPTATEFGPQRFYFTKTDPGIEVFSLSVPENTSSGTIGYAKALSGTTTWALTDANFAINSGTGVISVGSGADLDFEDGTKNAFELTIVATLEGVSTATKLNIEVTDVIDASPTITRFEDGSRNTITSALRGATVKIIGMNFSTTIANNTITVGGVTATLTSATATELTFTVPLTASLGMGNIQVEVSGAISHVEEAFTITLPSPTITRFEDTGGTTITSALIGDIVKIVGTNFSTTAAKNTITVGSATATPTNATATELTFTVPLTASPGSGPIRVTVSGAASYVESAFEVTLPSPTITEFQDGSRNTITFALIGDIVKIVGTNFSTTAAKNTITVGSATATPTNATATELTFTVPLTASPGSGPIRVTVSGAASYVESAFEVTLPSPTITEFQDGSGAMITSALRGATVKIIGTNFSTTAAKNTITVGGATATLTNATATVLTFTVSLTANIGSVPIRVTVSGAANYVQEAFTITAPPSPTITRFEDAGGTITSALRGATVKIIGMNFSTTEANNTITVGSATATLTSATATELTFTVPAGASPGSGKIRVTVSGAISHVEAAFTITLPSPTITHFEDGSGAMITSALIGDIVKIVGTNFSTTKANNTITVGSATATLTSATATELTFTVPLTATLGLGKIRVTVSGAISHVEEAFTITAPPSPTITRFEDAGGTITSALRGATVKIIGMNFSTTAAKNTITVGGVTATPTNATATELTFTVPLTATLGLGNIQVEVSGAENAAVLSFTITLPSPTITRFEDAGGTITSALRGATVKIIGMNFSTTKANNTITVGSATATLTSATATELTFTVPAGASPGSGRQIRVTVSGAENAAVLSFTITPPSPTITRFEDTGGTTITSALIGDIVKIIGNNFSTTLANNTITVGGATATLTNATATVLTFTVPLTATLGSGQILRVTVLDAVTAAVLAFEVTAPPLAFAAASTTDADVAFTGVSGDTKAKYVVTKTLDEVDESGDVVLTLNVDPSVTTTYAYVDMDGADADAPTGLVSPIPASGAISTTAALAATSSATVFYVKATRDGASVIAKVELTVNAPLAFAAASESYVTLVSATDLAGSGDETIPSYTLSRTTSELGSPAVVILTVNAGSGSTYSFVADYMGADPTTTTTELSIVEDTGVISTTATAIVTDKTFYVKATRDGSSVVSKVVLTVTAPPPPPPALAFAEASTSDTDVAFTGASGTEKAKYVVTKTLDEVDESGDVVLTLNVDPSVTTTYAYVDMDGTSMSPPTGLAATINTNGTISTDAALAVTSTARVFYVKATRDGASVIAKVELTVNAPLAFAAASTTDADVAFTGVSGDTKAKYVVTKTLDEVDASGDVVLTLNVAPSGTTAYAYVDMDGTLLAGPPTGLAATINTNGTISTDAALAVTSMATVFYVQATQGGNTVIAKVELTVNAPPALAFAEASTSDTDVGFTGAMGAEKAKYVVTKTLDEVDASGDVVLTLNVAPSGTTTYAYVDMDGADADAPSGLVSPIPASGAISTDGTLAVTSSATVFYVKATRDGASVIAKVELTVNAAATTDFFGLTNLAHDLVSLYPNPASDRVYVSGLKSGDVYIYEIYSFLGQKVGTGQLSEGPSIDLKGLSAGAYVLILRSESGEEVFRSRCLISK